MKGGGIILNRAREAARPDKVFTEDNITQPLTIDEVELEKKKYDSFWEGIHRRIAMKKNTPLVGNKMTSAQVHEIRKRKEQEKTVIHPLNNYKVLWDLWICFLVIYSVIMIPIRIGFDTQPALGFIAFDFVIDCVFFVDMFLTFNTAYKDPALETYVYSRQMIAANYLKFWFWVDLISTVPVDDLVRLFVGPDGHFEAIRAVRILRLGRLFKLQRVSKLTEYLEEKIGISPSQINLIMLMMQIFFIAHVFSCFWHMLGQPSSDTARTWLTEFGFDSQSLEDQYIASLYFTIVTMLTVGYGDIHPTNPGERAFSIFMMLSGGVIFGALLSKVASVIEKRHPQAKAFKENMDEVRAFLEEYSLPLPIKVKAKEAYSYYLAKKSSFGESGIFDDLPQPLLFKLVLQLYEKDIKKVQMFSTYECSFVVALVINSKPFQAVRGETLFHQGDVCKEIIFIPTGMVRLSIEGSNGQDVLAGFATEGTYFGDMEYLKKTVVTMAQYSAMNNCEFLSVSYTVMSQAIAQNLDSGTSFKKEMERRVAAFVKVIKSQVKGDHGGARRTSLRPRYAQGRYARRSSTTTGAHASIWLNGHERDHTESAHYIRMALRNSSENLVLHASKKRASISAAAGRGSSENLFGLSSGPSGLSGGLSSGPLGLTAGSTGTSYPPVGLSGLPLGGSADNGHPVGLSGEPLAPRFSSASMGLPGLPLGGFSVDGRLSGMQGLSEDSLATGRRAPRSSFAMGLPGLPPNGLEEVPSSSSGGLVGGIRSSGLPGMPPGGFSSSGQPLGLPFQASTASILSMVQSSEEDGGTSCRVLTYDEDGTQLVADISHTSLHKMLLVDPKEPWKVHWDIVLALVILYTIIMTPVEIAFYNNTSDYSNNLEYVLDGIFFADLFLSFRTCCLSDVEGALVIDQSAVALSYLKSWFIVDFLSSIPYGPIFGSIFSSAGLKSVKLIKALRLIRLTKLIRIFKLDVVISRMEDTLGLPRSVFELLQVLVEVFFIGHLVACLWWGVSDAVSEYPWFTQLNMVYKDLSNQPIGEKYLFSLYFTFTTMTTVGYGDIYSSNSGEMILNILLILLGASVFGYIIANVSTILEGFSRIESVRQDRIGVIKEYLSEKGCPAALEKKVVGHFKHLFSITSAYSVDKILSRLPPSLRDEILFSHNEMKIRNIPIFKYIANRSLVLHIFHLLAPVFYEADQYIIKQARETTEISFLVIGTACAFTMDKKHTKEKKKRRRQQNLFSNMTAQDEAQYHQARKLFLSTGSSDAVDIDEVINQLNRKALPKISPKESFEQKVERGGDNEFDGFSSDFLESRKIPMSGTSPLRLHTSSLAGSAFNLTTGSDKDNMPSIFADTGKEHPGVHIIGDFNPGDFVGHASLMNEAPNECSIVATSPCTIYVLSKAVIYKLIHSEPVVGLRLQEALASAISAQAKSLGQAHRRHNRAEFLRDLKDKAMEFHSKIDPTLKRPDSLKKEAKDVKSALTALHDRESTVTGKGFFGGTVVAEAALSSPGKTKIKPRRRFEMVSKKVSLLNKIRNFRSLRRHLSYKAGVFPIAEERDEMNQIPKGAKAHAVTISMKKLKRIDHVLNDKTMMYDSDDDDEPPKHTRLKERAVAQIRDFMVSSKGSQHETPRKHLQRILRRALRQLRYQKTQKIAAEKVIAQHKRTTQAPAVDLPPPDSDSDSDSNSDADSSAPKIESEPKPVVEPKAEAVNVEELVLKKGGRYGAHTLPPISLPPLQIQRKTLGATIDTAATAPPAAATMPVARHSMTDLSSARSQQAQQAPLATVRRHSSLRFSVSRALSSVATSPVAADASMSRYAMKKIKNAVNRNRRWSFAAIEGSFNHLGSFNQKEEDEENTGNMVVAPAAEGSTYLDKKIFVRVRRQSYPSLSNQTWKDSLAFQGLL